MVTKAQMDKLHARIDEVEAKVKGTAKVAGCVIEIPREWATGPVWARHCELYPEDASAEHVVFISRFSGQCDPDRGQAAGAQDSDTPLSPYGWRGCDDRSWRDVARKELAAGRDPNVSLKETASKQVRASRGHRGGSRIAPRA